MHTLWVREHNRVAQLIKDTTNFDDEHTFQLARSIVIAEIQKITYTDYLPKILGPNLIPDYNSYSNNIVPNLPNAFATAAFRFGHSQVQPAFEFVGDDGVSTVKSLNEVFFNPDLIRSVGIEPVLRGMLINPSRALDEFINSVLTSHLLSRDPDAPGQDLASRNIQRGREHGIPPYGVWKRWARRVCNIESDFRSDMVKVRLLEVYGSIENVDLFVAGLAEKPLPGGLVGATFGCIISIAFTNVRDGDRFFYKRRRPNNPGRNRDRLFTVSQIMEVDKTSLSRVICNNAQINMIQKDAFVLPGMNGNDVVSCSDLSALPDVDLSEWIEPALGNDDDEEMLASEEMEDDKDLFAMLESIVDRLEKEEVESTNPYQEEENQKVQEEDMMNSQGIMKWWSQNQMMPKGTMKHPPPPRGFPMPVHEQGSNGPDIEKIKKMSALLDELIGKMSRK